MKVEKKRKRKRLEFFFSIHFPFLFPLLFLLFLLFLLSTKKKEKRNGLDRPEAGREPLHLPDSRLRPRGVRRGLREAGLWADDEGEFFYFSKSNDQHRPATKKSDRLRFFSSLLLLLFAFGCL